MENLNMMSANEHLTRQMDIIPLNVLDIQINIIGAGAIGSTTAVTLAKMGFKNLIVYDDDVVDTVNMSNQGFRFKDIGKKKVEALAEIVKDFANVDIIDIPCLWTGATLSGIVICAVDNMKTRQDIHKAHINNPKTSLVIDPRMAAEMALLYVYSPTNSKAYKSYAKTLYSDSEAMPERCTAKATMYCATMLSGLVTKTVKTFVCGQGYAKNISWDMVSDDFVVGNRIDGDGNDVKFVDENRSIVNNPSANGESGFERGEIITPNVEYRREYEASYERGGDVEIDADYNREYNHGRIIDSSVNPDTGAILTSTQTETSVEYTISTNRNDNDRLRGTIADYVVTDEYGDSRDDNNEIDDSWLDD